MSAALISTADLNQYICFNNVNQSIGTNLKIWIFQDLVVKL